MEHKELIQSINRTLETLKEGLKVGTWSECNGRLAYVGVSFPVKGNKEIVEKLKTLGWEVGRCSKVRNGNRYLRNQYEGYTMRQEMRYYF